MNRKRYVFVFGVMVLAGALSACAVLGPPAVSPSVVPQTDKTATQSRDGLSSLTIINQLGCATTLDVEIASTPQDLQTGLMNRASLLEMRGMLFDFSLYGESVSIPFYMKDTLIPLSIAFIAGDGTIVDIQDMEPLTETLHYPAKPYRKALEVNQGWFERHGIKVGDTVQYP